MPLSEKKRRALRNMKQSIPALRKGQFAAEGDLNMDELLGNAAIVHLQAVTINADPKDVSVPLAKTTDFIMEKLLSDDSGATLGAIVTSIPADGTVRINPTNAPTNNDGVVLILVLRDLA